MAKRLRKKKRSSESPQVPGRPLPQKVEFDFKVLFQVLVIIAAGCWIFWPALHGEWLWDDNIDITENSITHSATGLWNIWFEPGSQVDYYPVKASVQWFQWHLWGEDTLGYHVTNLFLHLVSALLVWGVFRKLGLRLAWLGGLLFVLHPAAVESVAWIAELKNVLSMPPFLLAVCFYLDFEKHHRPRDCLLALLFFLAAMLCKTTMVMFPVIILLYAWWKRNRLGWNDLKISAPFFLISLVLGLATIGTGMAFRRFHHMPLEVVPVGGLFSRLALAGLSLSFYFWKAVWPVDLAPIYPQWPVNPPSLVQFLPWPVFAGIFYTLWLKRHDWARHILFGGGFFVIMLAPFVSVSIGGYTTFTWVMDHFLYIPILGLIGLVVAGLGQLEARLSSARRFGVWGVMTVVLIVLAWGSHEYAYCYSTKEALWSYAVARNPGSWTAHYNLGNALFKKGESREAIAHYEQAVKLKPDYADALINWGYGLALTGHQVEGIALYQQALRINPDLVGAENDWGNALLQMGRYSEAIPHFQRALRLKPDFAEACLNWGNALVALGRIPDALAHYQEALQLKPDFGEVDENWGDVLLQTGRFSEAIQHFQSALKTRPDDAGLHYNWGNALVHLGQPAEALVHYQEAVRLNPASSDSHGNMAVALIQLGRKPEAIEQLQEALRLDPNNVSVKNNLAKLTAPMPIVPNK